MGQCSQYHFDEHGELFLHLQQFQSKNKDTELFSWKIALFWKSIVLKLQLEISFLAYKILELQ